LARVEGIRGRGIRAPRIRAFSVAHEIGQAEEAVVLFVFFRVPFFIVQMLKQSGVVITPTTLVSG